MLPDGAIVGRLISLPPEMGFGFVRVKGHSKDIFVRKSGLRKIVPGDESPIVASGDYNPPTPKKGNMVIIHQLVKEERGLRGELWSLLSEWEEAERIIYNRLMQTIGKSPQPQQ